jgi:hypothetical protein
MGFNRRKMEDQRRDVAEKKAVTRRARKSAHAHVAMHHHISPS